VVTEWSFSMLKRILLIIISAILLVACKPGRDEMLALTLAVQAEKALALTPSPVPPQATPTETASVTVTEQPTATITDTPIPTSTPDFLLGYPETGYGPVNFPTNINPLTGLQIALPELLERRPVSVKISSYPRGIRPQWGLTLADHVFEYYHEGGLTRFNAIYYGNNAMQIGPIRSARFSDKDIVEMYKAFFAYASGDVRVRERLSYSNFTDRMATITDYPCPPTIDYPLCRIEPDTWNHLVTRSQELYQHFEKKGVSNQRQNLDGMYFNLVAPTGGSIANNVLVRYSFGSYHKWVYDPTSGRYFRQQDTLDVDAGAEVFEPTIDRLNGQPVSASNVVLLLAPHEYFLVRPEMIEIPFNGSGKVYFFRDGQGYRGTWTRVVDSELLILSDEFGNRFPLKPGNTWFVVLGQTSQAQSESPDWRFQFYIP
jgi:hypothetical protein